MVTKPQAKALRKWVDHGKPAHPKALRINEGVYDRLSKNKLVESAGLLVRCPTEKGLVALKEYEEKHGLAR